MPIALHEIRLYGSAVMPDDDSVTAIGGAIDTSKRVEFTDVSGTVQAVSSAAGDTTQSITVTYRDSAGNKLTESQTLSGQTPVAFTANMERLLKALKSATTAGDVAVEATTAERTGTAQGGDSTSITLDAGASSTDQAYLGMIVRLTSGTGAGQIRQIIDYNGTTKVAKVDHPWTTSPDSTTAFRLARGFYFEKAPNEVMEVRRVFFDAAADAPDGAAREFHDKVFFLNTNASLALTSSVVSEVSDPLNVFSFGLAATLDDNGTNGTGNNRLVAPSGVTFNSSPKSVPNGGSLSPGSAIGVWLKLSLAAGAAAAKTTYQIKIQGNTV